MLNCRNLSRLGLLVICAAALAACGGSQQTEKRKTYRLAVINDDAKLKAIFKGLIDDFNTLAGVYGLEYVDSADQANSPIIVTKGLRQRDKKVGWGQWMAETVAPNPLTTIPGTPTRRTITYTMRVEFDADYFYSRLPGGDNKANEQTKHYEMQKLFFHEVGHGLEMDHNVGGNECDAEHSKAAERDVMFCDVAGDKDFPTYFTRVRQYLADTGD